MAAGISNSNEPGGNRAGARAGKYLAFRLGREEFAISVLNVREIMGMQEITAVPHAPAHIRGVINLRGKVVPIIDLRAKFGLAPAEGTRRTCIIVTQIHSGAAPVLAGVVVDGVSEVVKVMETDIENTPDFGEDIGRDYLLGMAKVKETVKILLDIDRALSLDELLDASADRAAT